MKKSSIYAVIGLILSLIGLMSGLAAIFTRTEIETAICLGVAIILVYPTVLISRLSDKHEKLESSHTATCEQCQKILSRMDESF